MKYKRLDVDFMSQPRNIPILERLIIYIENENFGEQDLQAEDQIHNLLMHCFLNNKVPEEEFVESVRALFSQTSFIDFKRHLYRYSEIIATYLWVDRVQEIVTEPKEKRKILKGKTVNSYGYQLFCSLTGIDFVDKSKQELSKDQDVQLFRNMLRCTDAVWKNLEKFIDECFCEDYNEEEKNEITHCTKKFLEERMKCKRPRRCVASPIPPFDSEALNDSESQESCVSAPDDYPDQQQEQEDHSEGAGDVSGVPENSLEIKSTPPVSKLLSPKNYIMGSISAAADFARSLKRTLSRISLSSSSGSSEVDTSAAKKLKNQEKKLPPAPEPVQEQVTIKQEDDGLKLLYEYERTEEYESSQMSVSESQNFINRSILDEYEKMWLDQVSCDVEFIAPCDRKILAHKFVLSAGSKVFFTMFMNETPENSISGVFIKDLSYEVIEEMLRFMYSGRVKNLELMLDELLLAAEVYKIDLLKMVCKEYLEKNLSDANAIATFKLCKDYGFDDLKEKAKEYIDKQLEG